MTATANGPTPTLPASGAGQQISDGNPTDYVLKVVTSKVGYTDVATLLASDILGGAVTFNNGSSKNLTLPLCTDLDAAVPNAIVGSSFEFSVTCLGAGSATVVTNTGWTTTGYLVVAQNTASRFRARKTGTGTWDLLQVA